MYTTQDQVKSNNKHSRKITWNRSKNQTLAIQIKEFFDDNFNFSLPANKKEFTRLSELNFVTPYGDDFSEYRELGIAYYNLNMCNKAIYGLFEQGQEKRQQMISCLYTRHRLDHVWNYRKSQLIRKRYREYLTQNPVHEHYTPMHLVLTVPHKDGVWRGKRFYGRELLKSFNLMRKHKVWLDMIHAGEYGMEISKKGNSKNGLHIHIHSLVFINPAYNVEDVETFIRLQWQKLTDATQIHLEPLYIHKKDKSGRWIKTVTNYGRMFVHHKTGEITYQSTREERTKYYLTENWYKELPSKERLETAVTGILEAIKYHFKNDALLQPNGDYDLQLVAEVLANSKYLRMYSKFGAFYGEGDLNFNNLKEDVQIPVFENDFEDVEDISDLILSGEALDALLETCPEIPDTDENQEQLYASAQMGESMLINPFTYQPAEPEEYQRVLALPELMSYQGKHQREQYRQIVQDDDFYFKVANHYHISYVMQLLAKGKYEFLEPDEEIRFKKLVQERQKIKPRIQFKFSNN